MTGGGQARALLRDRRKAGCDVKIWWVASGSTRVELPRDDVDDFCFLSFLEFSVLEVRDHEERWRNKHIVNCCNHRNEVKGVGDGRRSQDQGRDAIPRHCGARLHTCQDAFCATRVPRGPSPTSALSVSMTP